MKRHKKEITKVNINRRFLVYCPTYQGDYLAELDGPDRIFDVALNDYSGEAQGLEIAEWQFAHPGHKWPGIAVNIEMIDHPYEMIAFIDNDLSISTQQLNTLFLTGDALNLDLFQASLSEDSKTAWPQLKQCPGSHVRATNFVEIMMPIFSRRAVTLCRSTFTESESGWGLDMLWAKQLNYENMAIVDAVVVGHRRPITSDQWRNHNGQTAQEEFERLRQRYGL